jgi:OTU domain-containing protein 3
MFRKTAVYKQLSEKHLAYVDVTGDGNCFYRAISCTLHDNESQHAELRRLIAEHPSLHHARIFKTSSDVTSAERASIEDQRVQRMRVNGVWVGEEAILAAADLLQRELHVFKYVTSVGISPSVYLPVAHSARRRNHHVRR